MTALRKLDCPGVPKLIDDNCGTATDTDELYAVMEFLPGPMLEEYMKACPRPLDEALAITEAILAVVECSHAGGLLHRDIKPDSIVLRGGDPAKPALVDFGRLSRSRRWGTSPTDSRSAGAACCRHFRRRALTKT